MITATVEIVIKLFEESNLLTPEDLEVKHRIDERSLKRTWKRRTGSIPHEGCEKEGRMKCLFYHTMEGHTKHINIYICTACGKLCTLKQAEINL